MTIGGPDPGSVGMRGAVAVVTGAGRGIGRAAALELARQGCEVVVISRTADELAELVGVIRSAGGTATALVCDVTDEAALEAAMGTPRRVDILVNAAGTNVPEPFVEVESKTFELVMDLNLRATFVACQLAVRRMLDQGTGGSIVNVSSQMGHVGARNRSVYCASKHAVEGLTKALAVELGPHAIRVNTVAPTFVETSMTAPFLAEPEFLSSVLAEIPLGRVGNVEEVATAITFLASPGASLVTGTSLVVDGGWTAH